eukprot:12687513-Alexandrium_andersonii.AAC.1
MADCGLRWIAARTGLGQIADCTLTQCDVKMPVNEMVFGGQCNTPVRLSNSLCLSLSGPTLHSGSARGIQSEGQLCTQR